jgi:hypothetical protein
MAALPFLAFLGSDRRMKHDIESVGELNDGQPVYRFKYNGDDKTRMGLMAQDVEKDHPEAVKGLGGVKMVDYKRATDAAARQGHADGERVEVTGKAPQGDDFLTKLASTFKDAGDTAVGLGKKAIDSVPTNDTFWVPAIAGLGSMLASPNKTLAGAIGSGLVGGATTYEGMQKQNAAEMKQRFDIAKSVFTGPTLNTTGEWTWGDSRTGEQIPQDEYKRRYDRLVGGGSAPAPQPMPAPTPSGAPTVSDEAKRIVSEPAPKLEPKAPPKPAPMQAEAEPSASGATAPKVEKPTVTQMYARAYEDEAQWQGYPPSMNPRILLPEVAQIDREIKGIDAEVKEANRLAAIAAERSPDQSKNYEAKAARLQAQAAAMRKERDDKAAAAQKSLDAAIAIDRKRAEEEAAATVRRDYEPQITPGGEKASLPPGMVAEAPVVPKPTPEQAAAPKIAEVDNKTGQLTLARPAAPAGGGLIQPNLPPGSKVIEQSPTAKNQNAMDEQFLKDFMEKAPSVSQAKQRYMGLINAFKMFESGSTEGTRAAWAAVAQTFGFPDIAQKIASGDPAGVQWVEKIGPNLVLDTLKAATPRFAQSEFITIQRDGTPSPNKLPDANFEMVKEGLATLNRTDAFMQAWQRASQEEGWRSPSAYYLAWSKANPIDKFMKATERQMGNFAGMPLPPSSEWTPGAIYVVPNNLSSSQSAFFRSRGMKAGDAFQYGGSEAPPDLVIKPIPKRQLYSTPAMGQ